MRRGNDSYAQATIGSGLGRNTKQQSQPTEVRRNHAREGEGRNKVETPQGWNDMLSLEARRQNDQDPTERPS